MSPAIRLRRTEPELVPPGFRAKNRYTQTRADSLAEPGRKYRADVRLSVTVMAHEKRALWVPDLQSQLGPDCTITWDQINNRHDTGIRAIMSYDPDATHHLVVQDDAIVAENIVDILLDALRFVPDKSPVGLYYGSKGTVRSTHASAWHLAETNSAAWLARKGPIWGPGIVYPVSTIPGLHEFYVGSQVENYDRRVMRFYQSIGADCFYSVPSLVDHRTDGNPSLIGHDRGVRAARRFIGPRAGVEVDWSGPVVRSRQ